MIETLFAFQFHALAVIGLVSVGVLPVRCWLMVRASWYSEASPSRKKAHLGIALAFAPIAITGELLMVTLVTRCMTGIACYPDAASGWGHLAFMGAMYLAFELAAVQLLALSRNR